MKIHPLAGKSAPQEFLVDVDKLRKEYCARKPDVTDNAQRVNFRTSGHRGSSLLAQAILYRGAGISAVCPLFLSLAVIGAALFAPSLARFRKTIGTMA